MPDAPLVTIVESGPPKMPSPTARTINVSDMNKVTPTPVPDRQPVPKADPAAEPPKQSARDRMKDSLRNKAKDEGGNLINKPPVGANKPAESGEPTPADPNTAPATAPAADPAKPADGKKNPWKLVDEYKARATKAENELLETSKRAIPEAKWKEMETNLQTLQKRRDELESEIRYHDYSKSTEFQEQYQKPYEAAWQRSMSELGEIPVEDNGTQRAMNTADLLELVNLPLAKAKVLADEKFGTFSGDVMAARKEIRGLYDKQSAALEQARKDAGEREKQRAESTAKQRQEMSTQMLTEWKSANDEVMANPEHGKYFQPKEGDAEGNQRLAKGFELADRAFSESPGAPNLTPEQRREIVKRHAAVRLRAAAYGRLKGWNAALEKQVVELTTELASYKGSEPALNGSRETPTGAQPTSARDRMHQELRKKMKPI